MRRSRRVCHSPAEQTPKPRRTKTRVGTRRLWRTTRFFVSSKKPSKPRANPRACPGSRAPSRGSPPHAPERAWATQVSARPTVCLMCAGARGAVVVPPGSPPARARARGDRPRARGAGRGRARAGARDPSLAPVHDADAHDAAIVSFVFSSGRFKKGLSFPRGTRVRWTRGGKARGERGDADAGLEAKRGVPEGRPTLVTFVARARARSASGPRDASISFQTRRR